MNLALDLAHAARFSATPNPSVGCVLVKDDRLIGEGAHVYANVDHAEIVALKDAKQKGHDTKGATAYVTLEPCAHQGRTGPCAAALRDAGIATLIYATADPSDQAAGGAAQLADAGVEVIRGVGETRARWIHRGFLKRVSSGKPWVRAKMACSLDGRTALPNGESQWISNVVSRTDVQFQRAEACAVLAGVGTVLADDPSLNVRLSDIELGVDTVRQPLRVITDAKGLLTGSEKLFSLEGNVRIYTRLADYPLKRPNLSIATQSPGPGQGRQLDLGYVLDDLGTHGINFVHLEAGAKLAGGFLQSGLVDELVVYLAPKLMGHRAFPAFEIGSPNAMADLSRWSLHDCTQFGDDLKLTYLAAD
ncbi:MAG: bifunctional diaminohydroxyphosphoribosylaminopyrimidine deaminase/5-amino-6-(5-phosphoribosylamino)uracil reductase RibD [Gammaproteobacteria bacterium]|nr:bifunctional diaminohydroxyphosphoribosylaminopyrimidine deaminase/5-amino-6-(5-phosphoribosylamino)uracil reductase RibD [Gammaproteobacteria bacterium]